MLTHALRGVRLSEWAFRQSAGTTSRDSSGSEKLRRGGWAARGERKTPLFVVTVICLPGVG